MKNRVSIPLVVMQTDEKQVQEVHENVQQDRKLAIEACIVRVMKVENASNLVLTLTSGLQARVAMTHSALVNEVIQALSVLFRPDARIIKKRIEDLIQREFLERDEAGTGYKYRA